MSDDNKETEDAITKLNLLKATAIRQAMFEVIAESKPEIIRRARAKLVAMGVTIGDDEVEAQL